MSYTLIRYGDLVLPEHEKIQDLDTAVLAPSSVRTINGGYRIAGSGRRRQNFPYTQTLECTVHDTTLAAMRTAIDALRAKSGEYDRLLRYAEAGTEIHWCYADLAQFRHRRVPARKWWYDIKLDFEIWTPWYGVPNDGFFLNDGEYINDGEYVNDTVITKTLTSSQYSFVVTNGGNLPVKDAIVQITAGAVDLDDLTIHGDDGTTVTWGWFFLPTLSAGDVLTIDTANYAVDVNGTPNYEGFLLAGNHVVDTWFELVVGDSYLRVNWTGGATDAVFEITYKDAWA